MRQFLQLAFLGFAKPANDKPRTGRGRRSAFTLIELIAVMGIIVALSLIVVGGYGGMARSMASGQATRQLRDALLLARQTACVNGVRVYCYVLEENVYVLCRKIGTSSSENGATAHAYQAGDDYSFQKDTKVFSDHYSDLGSFINEADREAEEYELENSGSFEASSDMYIFDLSSKTGAKYGILRGVVRNEDLGFGWNLHFQKVDGVDEPTFKKGADYGIALFPVRVLPKGFVFLDDEIGKFVYFEPTGAADGTLMNFVVAESALRNDNKHRHSVTVSTDGKVDVPQ